MYFVYVLWFPKDGTKYIGQTNNLLRRVKQHLDGKVEYTKSRRPFKLIYVEKFLTREEAVKREKYLKSRSGRRYLDKILNLGRSGGIGRRAGLKIRSG